MNISMPLPCAAAAAAGEAAGRKVRFAEKPSYKEYSDSDEEGQKAGSGDESGARSWYRYLAALPEQAASPTWLLLLCCSPWAGC